MDFIKKAGASLGGNTNQQAPADGSAPVGGAPAGEQKQDYGDKGLCSLSLYLFSFQASDENKTDV